MHKSFFTNPDPYPDLTVHDPEPTCLPAVVNKNDFKHLITN